MKERVLLTIAEALAHLAMNKGLRVTLKIERGRPRGSFKSKKRREPRKFNRMADTRE